LQRVETRRGRASFALQREQTVLQGGGLEVCAQHVCLRPFSDFVALDGGGRASLQPLARSLEYLQAPIDLGEHEERVRDLGGDFDDAARVHGGGALRGGSSGGSPRRAFAEPRKI